MKVQVSKATPIQLNYLVAKCEGVRCGVITPAGVLKRRAFSLTEDEMAMLPIPTETVLHLLDHDVHAGYSPSTDWSQGGPIIEREGLLIRPQPGKEAWDAWKHGADEPHYTVGPTPLIAAMRCYVASKLGETVEVPEELC